MILISLPFLSSCIPYLQLYPFILPEDRLHLKINPDRRNERRRERIIGITEKEWGFTNARIADYEQLKHIIEILVGCIFGPLTTVRWSHLQKNAVNAVTVDTPDIWESLSWLFARNDTFLSRNSYYKIVLNC